MKYVALLLFTVFSATYAIAKPYGGVCYFYGDRSGKGIIRVTGINGKKDCEKVKKLLADSNPKQWEGLADRLQAKLGNPYKVTLFTTVEFEKSGHTCP